MGGGGGGGGSKSNQSTQIVTTNNKGIWRIQNLAEFEIKTEQLNQEYAI